MALNCISGGSKIVARQQVLSFLEERLRILGKYHVL